MKLDKLLNPRSVAVIGASREPEKVGYGVLKNLVKNQSMGHNTYHIYTLQLLMNCHMYMYVLLYRTSWRGIVT